jgi:TonB family protein
MILLLIWNFRFATLSLRKSDMSGAVSCQPRIADSSSTNAVSFSSARGFAALSLITTLLLCDCSSPNLAIEANPMPEKQVATYITSVTPSSAYDTPPKFLKGYAPFFPAMESKRRHWGYAVVEFSVTAGGATSDIRPITATAYSFAKEAMYAVQNWRFAPARKHGQPVVVRMRLPFTFRS